MIPTEITLPDSVLSRCKETMCTLCGQRYVCFPIACFSLNDTAIDQRIADEEREQMEAFYRLRGIR